MSGVEKKTEKEPPLRLSGFPLARPRVQYQVPGVAELRREVVS